MSDKISPPCKSGKVKIKKRCISPNSLTLKTKKQLLDMALPLGVSVNTSMSKQTIIDKIFEILFYSKVNGLIPWTIFKIALH